MDNPQPSQIEMGIIYMFTSPSNKSYIGQTIQSLEARRSQHVHSKGCRLLHHAIVKYGINNFKCEVLTECPDDELNENEAFFIRKYNTLTPNGYNLTTGGDSNYSVGIETRQLNSTIIKRKNGQEHLPLYVGTVRREKEIIGYKIKGHPNYPKQIKFVNSTNVADALNKCMIYYHLLTSMPEGFEVQQNIGRRRGDLTSSLPKYIYAIKENALIVGYFVQGHPLCAKRKKFHEKKDPNNALEKAIEYVNKLNT